jgi:hypothetical protein
MNMNKNRDLLVAMPLAIEQERLSKAHNVYKSWRTWLLQKKQQCES